MTPHGTDQQLKTAYLWSLDDFGLSPMADYLDSLQAHQWLVDPAGLADAYRRQPRRPDDPVMLALAVAFSATPTMDGSIRETARLAGADEGRLISHVDAIRKAFLGIRPMPGKPLDESDAAVDRIIDLFAA